MMFAALLARPACVLATFVLLYNRVRARKTRHTLRLSHGRVINRVPAKIFGVAVALADPKGPNKFDHSGAGSGMD